MKAGSQRTLDENLILQDGQRILASAVIYGANASGKSSIIMSMALMRNIILQGSLEAASPALNNLEFYPFVHSSKQSPMLFETEFIDEGCHFIYSFEIMIKTFDMEKRRQITSEQLWIKRGKRMVPIFERDLQKVSVNRDKRVLSLIQYDEKLLLCRRQKRSELPDKLL